MKQGIVLRSYITKHPDTGATSSAEMRMQAVEDALDKTRQAEGEA